MDTALLGASLPSTETGDLPDDTGDMVAKALARLWLSLARVRHHLNEQAQRQGLSLSAFLVLRPLVQSGPLRSSALAEAVCMDPSWISRQVAHLVERGLVERHADRADGRVCILAATEAGVETVLRLQETADAHVVDTVAGWSEQDRRHLAALLGRLADALEAGTGPDAARKGSDHA
jgi:DNA-binding MarR family transcriptional regulator